MAIRAWAEDVFIIVVRVPLHPVEYWASHMRQYNIYQSSHEGFKSSTSLLSTYQMLTATKTNLWNWQNLAVKARATSSCCVHGLATKTALVATGVTTGVANLDIPTHTAGSASTLVFISTLVFFIP